MKSIFLFFIISIELIICQVENKIKGNWLGVLKVSTLELRIVFQVSENEDGSLNALLDSPDQGAYGIPVDSVIFNDPYVKFVVTSVAGFYEGKFEEDSITGTWSQGGSSFPLSLIRSAGIKPPKRPQEPEPPLPYIEEEVTIKNEQDNLTLAGTFTYPENIDNLPVVILISGSGPQNRNEELLGHKPFLVLADHLTRNGIAVLRFDDRGIGQSTGDFSSATTEDFVTDVLAAVDYLETRKEIDQDKIGLIGHSEGGLVAPIASVKCDEIDFIILMAAPGLSGREILRLQTALIMRAGGAEEELISREVESAMKSYDIIINVQDSAAAREKLKNYFDERYAGMSKEEKEQIGNPDSYFDQQARMLLSSWFKYFLEYDPYPVLTKVEIPVLAINGEKDLQVPPKENLSLIEKAFKEGGNKNYTIMELPGLNHLFQVSETGSPNEYVKIEQTIAPDALNLITEWINQNVK